MMSTELLETFRGL